LLGPNRSTITPAQRAQINRLTAELNMFQRGTQLGPEQRARLANSLAAASNPASPVPQPALSRLANNLGNALSGMALTPQQRHQLAIDLNMLLHAGSLAPADVQLVLSDARTLLQNAGVNAEAVNAVTGDLTTLAGDLQSPAAPAATSSAAQPQP
jgi:hypothetical protein